MASKVSWAKHERLQKVLKQNAKRRDWERQQQGKDKDWDKTFTVIFVLGSVLFVTAWLAIGIAKAVILLSVGIMAGIVASFVV